MSGSEDSLESDCIQEKKRLPIFRVHSGKRTICSYPKLIFNGNREIRRRRKLCMTRRLSEYSFNYCACSNISMMSADHIERMKVESVISNNRKLVDKNCEYLEDIKELNSKILSLNKQLLIHQQKVKTMYKDNVQKLCEKMAAAKFEADKKYSEAQKNLRQMKLLYESSTTQAMNIFMMVDDPIEFGTPTRTSLLSDLNNSHVSSASSVPNVSSQQREEMRCQALSQGSPPVQMTGSGEEGTLDGQVSYLLTEEEKENHRKQSLARMEQKLEVLNPLSPVLEVSSYQRTSLNLNHTRKSYVKSNTRSTVATPSSGMGTPNDASTGRKRSTPTSKCFTGLDISHQTRSSSSTPSIYKFSPQPLTDELHHLPSEFIDIRPSIENMREGTGTPEESFDTGLIQPYRPSFLNNESFLNQIDYRKPSEIPTINSSAYLPVTDATYTGDDEMGRDTTHAGNNTTLQTSSVNDSIATRTSRRIRKQVSYEEPKCNRKIREGDPNWCKNQEELQATTGSTGMSSRRGRNKNRK